MGLRGPPPKPTRLKVIAGNPGKRPLNEAEPTPKAGTPKLPDWLSEKAKVEWKRIVPQLRRLGLLSTIDLAALASYCQAYAELEEATRILELEGRVVDSPVFGKHGEEIGSRKKAHPAAALQRDAMQKIKQFLSEFGLSPASRSRVKAEDPAEQASTGDRRESKFFGRA